MLLHTRVCVYCWHKIFLHHGILSRLVCSNDYRFLGLALSLFFILGLLLFTELPEYGTGSGLQLFTYSKRIKCLDLHSSLPCSILSLIHCTSTRILLNVGTFNQILTAMFQHLVWHLPRRVETGTATKISEEKFDESVFCVLHFF